MFVTMTAGAVESLHRTRAAADREAARQNAVSAEVGDGATSVIDLAALDSASDRARLLAEGRRAQVAARAARRRQP